MSESPPSQRACPICLAGERHYLHTQRFVLPTGHPLASGYDVVECQQCGFVFANTSVTQEDYDVFYAKFSKYEDGQTSTGAGDSAWDARRLHDTAMAIAARTASKNARILDLGCANGGLLAAFQTLGFARLVGVDPSPVCARITQEKLGVEAHAGSIYALPALGSFDMIILSHVMEHLSDLRTAATVAAGLLAPGGTLYVEVPDATRYTEFLVAPFQDFNTEHINHFSPRSLANVFASAALVPSEEGRKNIESAQGVPYPALYTFFKRSEFGTTPPIQPDSELLPKIKAYIAASSASMLAINERIAGYLALYPRLLVWGTGQLANKLLAETCLGEADIAAFVDSNPSNQGKMLHGIQIISPEGAREFSEPILITSTIHQDAIAEIISETLRLPNTVLSLR
jgi:2-polyprenyl-3-methyl-5-hydroxy-6-metoxy-1,4-benzoquinol methylase